MNNNSPVTEIMYLGHASIRLTSQSGTVIYIDPAIIDNAQREWFSIPADIVLITHEHDDHNQLFALTLHDNAVVIRATDSITDGEYNTISIKGIEIEAVSAYNKNHSRESSVGFIITIDGTVIYVAGDTSRTEQMETFNGRNIDYAFFPIDGIYNMDAKEAGECAEIIGAKNNIPYHTKNGMLFDMNVAENFNTPNRLILEPGEKILRK